MGSSTASKTIPHWLTPAEQAAVSEFVSTTRRALGADLLDVRLFGSRARRRGTDESDVDVALVVSAEGRRRRYDVYDMAFEIGLRHGVDLAPLVIEEVVLDRLRSRERGIATDIDEEGIPL